MGEVDFAVSFCYFCDMVGERLGTQGALTGILVPEKKRTGGALDASYGTSMADLEAFVDVRRILEKLVTTKSPKPKTP